jgi:hypothetical protein
MNSNNLENKFCINECNNNNNNNDNNNNNNPTNIYL